MLDYIGPDDAFKENQMVWAVSSNSGKHIWD